MGMDFANLVIIPVLSRSVSGLEVLLSKPLITSQYAGMSSVEPEMSAAETAEPEEKKPSAPSKKQGIILLLIQLAIFTAAGFIASSYYASTAFVYGAVVLGTFLSVTYAKKQLGGMSGDIAGYGIVWGELIGVLALVFC